MPHEMPVTSDMAADAPLALFISPVPMFPKDGGNRARMATMMEALRYEGYRIGFVLL